MYTKKYKKFVLVLILIFILNIILIYPTFAQGLFPGFPNLGLGSNLTALTSNPMNLIIFLYFLNSAQRMLQEQTSLGFVPTSTQQAFGLGLANLILQLISQQLFQNLGGQTGFQQSLNFSNIPSISQPSGFNICSIFPYLCSGGQPNVSQPNISQPSGFNICSIFPYLCSGGQPDGFRGVDICSIFPSFCEGGIVFQTSDEIASLLPDEDRSNDIIVQINNLKIDKIFQNIPNTLAVFFVKTQNNSSCLSFESEESLTGFNCPPTLWNLLRTRLIPIKINNNTILLLRERQRGLLNDFEVGDVINVYGFLDLNKLSLDSLIIRNLSKPRLEPTPEMPPIPFQPSCTLTANPNRGHAPLTVTFNLNTQNCTNGRLAYNSSPCHLPSPNSSCSYTFQNPTQVNPNVVVICNEGTAICQTNVTVLPPTPSPSPIVIIKPPSCTLTANPSSGITPLNVTFSLTARNCTNGVITGTVLPCTLTGVNSSCSHVYRRGQEGTFFYYVDIRCHEGNTSCSTVVDVASGGGGGGGICMPPEPICPPQMVPRCDLGNWGCYSELYY